MEFVQWLFSDFRTYIFLFVVLVVALELFRRHRKNKAPRLPPENYWQNNKEK